MDGSLALVLTAVSIHRRNPDRLRDLPAIQMAELGQQRQERRLEHRTHAFAGVHRRRRVLSEEMLQRRFDRSLLARSAASVCLIARAQRVLDQPRNARWRVLAWPQLCLMVHDPVEQCLAHIDIHCNHGRTSIK